MTTHIFPLGPHLKVHSKNAVPPTERTAPAPPYLIVLCHGFARQGTGTIQVPAKLPELRFATPHGVAHETDYQWFESLVKDGVSLEYDFKYLAEAGSDVVNYYLGKGTPKPSADTDPGTWLGYSKEDRLKKAYGYDMRNYKNNDVVSSAYAYNMMLFDPPGRFGGNKPEYQFDMCTLRKSCTSLSDLFSSLVTANASIVYSHVLCAFCREIIET